MIKDELSLNYDFHFVMTQLGGLNVSEFFYNSISSDFANNYPVIKQLFKHGLGYDEKNPTDQIFNPGYVEVEIEHFGPIQIDKLNHQNFQYLTIDFYSEIERCIKIQCEYGYKHNTEFIEDGLRTSNLIEICINFLKIVISDEVKFYTLPDFLNKETSEVYINRNLHPWDFYKVFIGVDKKNKKFYIITMGSD